MSNYVRFYLQTFDSNLDYTGEFIEITNDVDVKSLGKIKQYTDNQKYDVGTLRYSNFSLTLRNDHGRYSEVGVSQSYFLNKRDDSIIKVDWSEGKDGEPICGVAICGEAYLHEDITVFYGLINDTSSTQNVRDNKIKFSVQGLESYFSRVETNYSTLNGLSGSDTISDHIYALLNQAAITNLMTVDAGNITCSQDQVPDDISDLEETSVKEALDLYLEASNSILYVDMATQTVYVKPRAPSATSLKTFYGQASNNGSENIVEIKNVTNGINRTFNSWIWDGLTATSKDTASITANGLRKKDFNNSLLTNATKQGNLLNDYRDEFKNPKREFNLTSILDYSTAELFLFDRVTVDYPTVFYPSSTGGVIPRFGTAIFGEDRFPVGIWNLTIPDTDSYKIISRSLNLKNSTVEYEMREV